jgi:hypothetical protein
LTFGVLQVYCLAEEQNWFEDKGGVLAENNFNTRSCRRLAWRLTRTTCYKSILHD